MKAGILMTAQISPKKIHRQGIRVIRILGMMGGRCRLYIPLPYLENMLYGFAKVVMWTTLHFYFRRIVFAGRKTIPRDKPVILIANHSASFLDAMLLAVLMGRPLHFYARSDIFRKEWANRILRAFHMIPIYNVEHGKEDLKRNEETFAEGEKVLNNRGLLLIFPEGTSRVERIMLPLKKGTARVALQTEGAADFTLGLCVIPVGINYSAHRFRADIHIQTGDPTLVQDYEKDYRENPARGITRLTRDLEARFAETMFFVAQPGRTPYIDRLLELYRADVFHALDPLRGVPIMAMEKEVCAVVSGMDEADYESRWALLKTYDEKLSAAKLMDRSVNGRYQLIIAHLLLLLVGSPVFLLSLLLNAWPLYFGKYMADKKVTRVDFYTSVATAAGGFGYFLWWLILILAAILSGNGWFWLAVLTAPITLFLGMFWWEGWVSFLAHARYLLLRWQRKKVITELEAMRKKIAFWQSPEFRSVVPGNPR
jgi:1-acyl-sn-glycerol-3-phosphate acyltransferase